MSSESYDITDEIQSKVISQYKEATRLKGYIEALASDIPQLEEAAFGCLLYRTLEMATGVQLDVLGILVGQPRTVVDASELTYFGYVGDPQARGYATIANPTVGGRYATQAEVTGDIRLLTDDEYRSYIRARIARNTCKGTVEDVIKLVAFMSGSPSAKLEQLTNAKMRITLPSGVPLNLRVLLAQGSLLPKPAGVGLLVEYDDTIGDPVNEVPPVISGTGNVDEVLTLSDYGTWTNDPTNYLLQWTRNGSDIASATAETYTVVAADEDKSIRCVVTAINAFGNNSQASNAISVNTEYAIGYSGNGNTSGTAPASQTKDYGVTLALRTNSGTLAKTGATYDGWNTAADGSGTSYAAGANYTTEAAATMYAKWNEIEYTITYNGNSNTGGSVPSSQTGNYEDVITLRSNTGTLVRTGYTFDGWNTASNGLGTDYAEGASFNMPAANTTLYAKWVNMQWRRCDTDAAVAYFDEAHDPATDYAWVNV